jgi:hypothetical protein
MNFEFSHFFFLFEEASKRSHAIGKGGDRTSLILGIKIYTDRDDSKLARLRSDLSQIMSLLFESKSWTSEKRAQFQIIFSIVAYFANSRFLLCMRIKITNKIVE